MVEVIGWAGYSTLPSYVNQIMARLSIICMHSDIRDLISIDDVMEDEDLKLGPNGGLVFCLE